MVSGRKLIVEALRGPMQTVGWTQRAAGWFTRPIAPGSVGVVAVAAATEHAAPETADVTLQVHLRREDVEPVVQELTGSTYKDGGYRSVTTTTSIGYLMPESRWRSWSVSSENASLVAAELASLAQQYAQPYLERLAADPDLLLESVKSSIRMAQATGPCAVAVLLTRQGRPGEGRSFVERAVEALGDRTDPAADHLRQSAERFYAWLSHANVSRPACRPHGEVGRS